MKIKIDVKCTYSVECEFDNVPEEIAKKLIEMDEINKESEEFDWLTDHIRESDAYDWVFDVWNAEEVTED